jgi:hypothetical protein
VVSPTEHAPGFGKEKGQSRMAPSAVYAAMYGQTVPSFGKTV